MSRIVTFYSYKGGVGRTFALANIGVLLAQKGKRVLLMDWDLEAPGLDLYFREYLPLPLPSDKGTVHLLHEASTSASADWRKHVLPVKVPEVDSLRLLPSGSFASGYSDLVQKFSWKTFFAEQGGGEILERWRSEWKEEYDFVLVDSRTGITDAGGICTVLLPDFLVIAFTSNNASLEGAIAVAQEAQQVRAKLSVPRYRLTVLPLASRFDGRAEQALAEFWLELFSSKLKPFYGDWLPRRFAPRQILELTKIPYVTKFSFGEPMPVLLQSITDPDHPGYFLANAARLLMSDFRDAGRIIEPNQTAPPSAADEVRTLMGKLPVDEMELPRLLRQVEEEEGSGPVLAMLLNEVGSAFYYQAKYSAAEPFFRRSLTIDEQSLGLDHLDIARDLDDLARLLNTTSRVEEAEPLYRRALTIREKALGLEHPDVAESLNNLALLLKETNRREEAKPLYERALAIDQKSLGPEHLHVARDFNNLAWLLKDTNQGAEAQSLFRQSLAIREKVLGQEHPDVAESLKNLALLLKDANQGQEAEALFGRALEINERALGREHPKVAEGLNNLGWLLKDTDRHAEAEPLFRRALAIDEKSFGPDHLNVARDFNNLGWLLKDTDRHAEAEQLFRRALEIREKALSQEHQEHPDVAESLNTLAWLLKDNSRYAEAEPLFARALSIDRKNFGPEHPAVARDLNNLAELYHAQGQYEKAEPLYQQARAILQKVAAPETIPA